MIDWPSFLSSDARIDFWTIAVGIACNASCAILGCYLVLRRMSLLGDAVSHSILAGIAGAFLLTGSIGAAPMFVGALLVGLLTAFLTQSLNTIGNIPEDSSMGVVFTSLFAVGVILISSPLLKDTHIDNECVLYGLLDLVSLDTVKVFGLTIPRTLQTLVPMLAVVLVFVTVFWKELKIVSFDPQLATSMGINAALIHYLLMAMVAATTVASLEAVGAILVIAMLIVPAATAQLLTDRLGWMIVLSVLIGAASAIIGCLCARWANSNAAGMMAVSAGLMFTTAVILAPRHGLVSKAIHNLRLAFRIVAEDIIARLYREQESAGAGTPVSVPRSECVQAAGGGMLARLAVPFLCRRGQLRPNADGSLSLTPQGTSTGESLVRSHRLWEAYLDQYFDLPADHLHEPAEKIEHYIGPKLRGRLADVLSTPETDPHGRSIPPEAAEDKRPDDQEAQTE